MNSHQLGYMLEARTVQHLETVGYRAERVARSGRRNGGDLFACVDVVAVNAEGVELIQVTVKAKASARRKKIRDAGLAWPVRLWLWEKVNNRWTFTSEEIAPTRTFLFEDYEAGTINEAGRVALPTPSPALTETALKGRAT